jgi:hypothetical protein
MIDIEFDMSSIRDRLLGLAKILIGRVMEHRNGTLF